MFKRVISVSVICMMSSLAQANDEGARNLLIEKFERLSIQLPKDDESYPSIVLRLADLLSERARHLQNQELAEGCSPCMAGEDDRKRAIELYQQMLSKINEQHRSKVLLQMGHLYELQDEADKAVSLYKDVLSKSTDPVLKAEIYMSLGALYFKRQQYAQAQAEYQKALDINELNRKSLASYRLAWSQFHLGQTGTAISTLEKMLKTPILLTTNPQAQVASVDIQFKQEVSRDLATFMSRTPLEQKDIARLFELSETSVRIENITYLASELENSGHKKAAIHAWEFVQSKQSGLMPKLETGVRLTQLYKDNGEIEKSLTQMKEALSLFAQVKACDESQCSELRGRLRKYVIDWNKEEKSKPSQNLVTAYLQYLAVFSDDIEMTIWLAQLADQIKDYDLSYKQYKAIAQLQKGEPEKQETALVRMIEVAELSKKADLLTQARNHYLANTQTGSQTLAVKYQMAHDLYKLEQYNKASVALREIALAEKSDEESMKIRNQAADLALDALAILKDNPTIRSWAKEFSAIWPNRQNDFLVISTKAAFNEVARLSEGQEIGGAWEQLLSVDLSHSDEAEKIRYYKNKLILAEKLNKFAEARTAANELLSFSSVSKEDKQFALTRKAWLAELSLDFGTAYATTKEFSAETMNEMEKELKLAILAELASLDPTPHFRRYIDIGNDNSQKFVMALKLARSSKTPDAEIKKYQTILQQQPEVLGELRLTQALKAQNKSELQAIAKDKDLAQTSASNFAWTANFIEEFKALRDQLLNHSLDTVNEAKMARTIKARMDMLTRAENLLKSAVEKSNWTAQMLSVQLISTQAEKFYSELMSLPMPEGLTEEEQNQYMGLLSQQAAPYQIMAQDLKAKFTEFWLNNEAMLAVAKPVTHKVPEIKNLLEHEYQMVLEAAPLEFKEQMQLAHTQIEMPQDTSVNRSELELARNEVRKNPMNIEALNRLRELELKNGGQDMAAYLGARITSLKTSPNSEVK